MRAQNKTRGIKVLAMAAAALASVMLLPANASEVVSAEVDVCSQTEELYFTNRRLVDVEDVILTCWQKFGANKDEREYTWSAGPIVKADVFTKSGLYLLNNDGAVLTLEFQGHTHEGYSGVGNGFELKLTQKGDDIYGCVTWFAGFTGSDELYGTSWLAKADKNMNRYNNENEIYSARGSGLKIQFSTAAQTVRTVTFVGLDGKTVIDTKEVPGGQYGVEPPTPPDEEGYEFWKWDSDLTYIRESTTVCALYHKLYTVTFRDADGSDLSVQKVEETKAAEAPDMTGREGFTGWDCDDFDYVTGDLVVTAVYGTVPDEVTAAVATGALDDVSDGLIWCAAKGSWYTKHGVSSKWKDGATAVFAKDVALSVSAAMTVGKILLLAEAKNVTISGETLTFVSPATVQVPSAATVCFETAIAGESGFVVNGADSTSVVEFAGDYAAKGDLVVSAATLKTVDEGTLGSGNFEQNLTISDDGIVSLGSSAAQTMSGMISVAVKGHGYVITEPGSAVSFTSDKGSAWELRVAGDTFASKYNTLPRKEGGMTHVLAGGTLSLGSTSSPWGPQVWHDEGLVVEAGGTLKLTKADSAGVIMGFLIEGGTAINESSDVGQILYKWHLKDGATLTGFGMRVGYLDYYGKWSYIKASGTTPSTVSLDEIQLGYQVPAREGKYVGIQFQVADVTADDKTDLLVTSPITERPNVTLFEEGYRENLGVWKQGAGTLELAATTSACATGVFKLEAGVVRFPSTAGGDYGALVLTGDAEMNVANGAKVTFADSSEMSWTEGATLTFSGDMGRKAVRIGTDGSGLTAAQLAQVKFRKINGKTVAISVDSEGYLIPPSEGFYLRIR